MPYGNYSKQIWDIEKKASLSSQSLPNSLLGIDEFTVTTSTSHGTLFCDPTVLAQKFPILAPVPSYADWCVMQNVKPERWGRYRRFPNELIDDTALNGVGAHNWFVHMEDNLNTATGQFTRNAGVPPSTPGTHTQHPYYKYTRLVNVAWSSDEANPLDYMEAVKKGYNAGKKLADVVIQLIERGIKTNIIAHSLGNEVLMSCLETLAAQGYENKIAHVFLWDAAVPDTIFSSPATNENPLYQFPNAYKGAQKFTVLYSNHDETLGPLPPKPEDPEIFEKWVDPNGGWMYVGFALGFALIDEFPLPNQFKTVYNLANMLGESWSYYLDPKKGEEHRQLFYTAWVAKHPLTTSGYYYTPLLNDAMPEMYERYPHYYMMFSLLVDAGSSVAWYKRLGEYMEIISYAIYKWVMQLMEWGVDGVTELAEVGVENMWRLTRMGYAGMRELTQEASKEVASLLGMSGFERAQQPGMEYSKIPLPSNLDESSIFLKRFVGLFKSVNLESLLSSSEGSGPIAGLGSRKAQEMATMLLTIATSRGAEPRPALGWSGPDITDDNTSNMVKTGKIIRADQKDYLKTHSGMKIPSKEMMDNVYKVWLISDQGIKPFGRYK